MKQSPTFRTPDVVEEVPPVEVVRQWIRDAIRRKELLRALLRLAERKAAYDNDKPTSYRQEVCSGNCD